MYVHQIWDAKPSTFKRDLGGNISDVAFFDVCRRASFVTNRASHNRVNVALTVLDIEADCTDMARQYGASWLRSCKSWRIM